MQYKRIDFARPVAMPGTFKTRTRFDAEVDKVELARFDHVVLVVRGSHLVEVPWAQVAWAEVAIDPVAEGYLSKSQQRREAVQKAAEPDPLPSEPEKVVKKSGRKGKAKKGTSRARRPRAKKD